VETKSVSDYYDSSGSSEGRSIVVNVNARQQRRNILRYGGEYKDDSSLNYLFRFPSSNIVKLDDRYGRIYSIHQIGDTLKVIQRNKVSSYYLGRQLGKDASGNNTLVYSDDIIGDANKYEEEYGTTHFRSCQKMLRTSYFVDANNCEVVRDSPNGLFPIGSSAKMNKYFKDKISFMQSLSNYDIVAGVDKGNRMYYVTFIDKQSTFAGIYSDLYSETIRFSEDDNAWKSFHSFTPELYGNIGEDTFVSFRRGNIWLHNSTSVDRNNYYGVKRYPYVHIHCNQEPLNNKLWLSLAVHSSGSWSASADGDVEIAPTSKYPYGMKSKIIDFTNEEGIYVADFLCDLLTNASSLTDYDIHDLYNGRDLVGKEITIKINSSSANGVDLAFVVINALLL
jgi:hypothetical protein